MCAPSLSRSTYIHMYLCINDEYIWKFRYSRTSVRRTEYFIPSLLCARSIFESFKRKSIIYSNLTRVTYIQKCPLPYANDTITSGSSPGKACDKLKVHIKGLNFSFSYLNFYDYSGYEFY